MASYRAISVRQASKNALVSYRYLSKQASLARNLQPTKPSFIQWNSSLELSNLTTQHSSTATFHHLAEHTLSSNVTYCMNIGTWITASADKESPNVGSIGLKRVNYTDIRWPIEKILKERKKMVNRNDRIFAKTTDNPRLDGLDLKEIRYTNLRWPAEKMLKETPLEKNAATKVPEAEDTR